MHAMANMARRAARQAGQILLRNMDRVDLLHIEHKSPNDLVSEVDRQAEAAIVDVLHKAYPDHAILGEEGGESVPGSGGSEFKWIIDPLDGTLNYLQGIPHFCISIAAMRANQFEHAVVYDPVLNEEFVASRGGGAQLNGRRIRVAGTAKLEEAVLCSGIPARAIDEHLDGYMAAVAEFNRRCRGLRRFGAAALDLAYVAAGRVDGFWELSLYPWDIAAGALLVREAGGFVGDTYGGDDFLATGDVLAANPKIFKSMVQTLRKAHSRPI